MPIYSIPIIHNKKLWRKYNLLPGVLEWNYSMTESTSMESPTPSLLGWDTFRDDINTFLRKGYYLLYSYLLSPSRLGVKMTILIPLVIIRLIFQAMNGSEYKLWEIILEATVIALLVIAWCISLWVYPRWKSHWKEQLSIELEKFATVSQTDVTLDEEWNNHHPIGEPEYSIIIRQSWHATTENSSA